MISHLHSYKSYVFTRFFPISVKEIYREIGVWIWFQKSLEHIIEKSCLLQKFEKCPLICIVKRTERKEPDRKCPLILVLWEYQLLLCLDPERNNTHNFFQIIPLKNSGQQRLIHQNCLGSSGPLVVDPNFQALNARVHCKLGQFWWCRR